MLPVKLQELEVGLKISAPGDRLDPPATRTRPSCSTVMPAAYRAAAIEGAADQLPDVGLKISADYMRPSSLPPPATRTLPLLRSAIPARRRAVPIEPTRVHEFCCGL